KSADGDREPTKAELEAAKEEFAKLGAKYEFWRIWSPGKTQHHFKLAKTTTLDTLKKLPDFPFAHFIDLSDVKLNDGWLPDLAGARELRSVCFFSNPSVTDAWVVWLAGLPRLERLCLFDCQLVTDAGV